MTEKILTRTPKVLKELIVKEAQKLGISVNAMVLQIWWQWAENKEKRESV